jgi:hypothetical protein
MAMTTHRFTVERIDVTTKGSFEQASTMGGGLLRVWLGPSG